MGGGQAARFGLGNLDTFSYIGVMSAGMGPLGRGADSKTMDNLAADPKKANDEINLLWIACGKQDTAMKRSACSTNRLAPAGRSTADASESTGQLSAWSGPSF